MERLPEANTKPGGNPVKERLARGEFVIGATITVPSVETVAQIAVLGFDFLWIEMEHAPITLESLRAMVLAIRGLPVMPYARVPVVELWTAKRVLNAGALGVIFPFVNTPAQARIAAEACRYPPLGRRESSEGLASFRWSRSRACDFSDEDVLCVAMVEHAEAVSSIDQIAATPGVDVLFCGVSDLSFSLGLRGRQDEPLLNEAVAKIAAAARKHGRYLGRQALDAASIHRFHSDGFQFLLGPTDIELVRQGVSAFLGPGGRFRTPNNAKGSL